jgi:hypothetical protein
LITTLLPWIAVAVAIVAIAARPGAADASEPSTESHPTVPRWPALAVLLVLGLVSVLAASQFGEGQKGAMPLAFGFAAGIVGAILAETMGRMPSQTGAGPAGSMGLGVALAGAVSLAPPPYLEPMQMGLALGLAVGAWVLCSGREGGDGWSANAALFAGAVVAADALGRRAGGDHPGRTGVALGVVAVAIALVLGLLRGQRSDAWKPPACAVLLAGAGYLIVDRYIWLADVWRVFGAAAFVALALHLLLASQERAKTLRFGLAAVIAVAGATLAFATLRGYGMAVALLGATSLLMTCNNARAMLALGPFAALVAYRLFREANVAASRAPDIGQHYALIGVLLGAMLIVVALESKRATTRGGGAASALTSGLWSVLIAGAAVLGAAILAAKGYIGIVFGMGLGTFVAGLAGERGVLPLSLSMGFGFAMAAGYGWLEPIADLSRQEKLVYLYWGAPCVALAALAIAALHRSTASSIAPEEPQ